MLLGFLDRAVGGWPAAPLFGLLIAGPSLRRPSHRGLGPSEVEPSWVKLLRVKPLSVEQRRQKEERSLERDEKQQFDR